MKLKGLKKTGNGKALKSYELYYENEEGYKKTYEIISHSDMKDKEELGNHISGVSLCIFRDDKMLLLREFRMGVNRFVYNLCAGMQEEGESIEDAAKRELYEETGLELSRIIKILPPAYAAVTISDIKNQMIFAEALGETKDHSTPSENIKAAFYTREEVARLLETETFATRAQVLAYLFSEGKI